MHSLMYAVHSLMLAWAASLVRFLVSLLSMVSVSFLIRLSVGLIEVRAVWRKTQSSSCRYGCTVFYAKVQSVSCINIWVCMYLANLFKYLMCEGLGVSCVQIWYMVLRIFQFWRSSFFGYKVRDASFWWRLYAEFRELAAANIRSSFVSLYFSYI